MDLAQKLEGIVIDEVCTLRPNDAKDAPKKQITLHFDFSDCTINDVLGRAVAPLRINFQNGNRKHFDTLATEYTIEVKPVGIRDIGVSEVRLIEHFQKLSAERQAEILDKLLASQLATK